MLYPNNQRGSSLVECTVTLPFFILLFFGSFEFGLVMQKNQMVSMVSRESGNATYRTCAFEPTVADKESCMQEVLQNDLQPILTGPLENTKVILKVFEFQPGTPDDMVDLVAVYEESFGPHAPSSEVSKYPGGSTLHSSFPLSSINADNPVIVTSEVYHSYNTQVSQVYQFVSDGALLYETTIY